MHPVCWPQPIRPDQPLDGRAGRDGAGSHHELVVGDLVLNPGLVDHVELSSLDFDLGGEGVEPNLHPGGLEIVESAMGQIAPVGDLA